MISPARFLLRKDDILTITRFLICFLHVCMTKTSDRKSIAVTAERWDESRDNFTQLCILPSESN